MAETKKSSAQERRVVGYLKPANFTFVENYIKQNEISESKVINEAVKALRDKVNEPKQRHDY